MYFSSDASVHVFIFVQVMDKNNHIRSLKDTTYKIEQINTWNI